MREVLRALAAGEITVTEAEAQLSGYATTEAGRFDAARVSRRGVPEAILAEGKEPSAVAELVSIAVETTGRAIVTRVDDEGLEAAHDATPDDATVVQYDAADTIVIHATGYEPADVDATVVVVTAGTSDGPVADEAAVIAQEMGATVERVDDVGVAGIHRLFDQLDRLRSADVAVVAAGREGALPTVVAGLIDTPVIGLPVSTGYGAGGEGEAALLGMLQSCSVLSVVNVDAGFVAGAQAGLIAKSIDSARRQSE